MTAYAEFLSRKRRIAPNAGIAVTDVHPSLFPFQADLVRWALRKGRAALFADTGLGKTRMQVEWAHQLDVPTLILAPLAVADQTVAEAARMGIEVVYAKDQSGVAPITITNYERLHKFEPETFGAVVLDESSILKSFSGTTKRALVASFKDTTYRLCCTATPAPNDIEELCNHADFLGVMSPQEMRSTYFIADSRGEFMRYRLKGHARESFYRWLASWAAAIQRPADLGYPDEAFELPPLNMEAHIVHTDWAPEGKLFSDGLNGIGEASQVRRATLGDRVAVAADLIRSSDQPWLAWCGLNDEQDQLARLLGPEAVSIDGRTGLDDRITLERAWREGDRRVLITKPSVFGFGMNWQHCSHMTFVGIGYSYEQYYQAIRRCWRFGQTRPVHAHVIVSEPERDVLTVVQQKEQQARKLTAGLLTGMTEFTAAEIFGGTSKGDAYEPTMPASVPAWLEATR